jgi:hypothetical protein
MVKAAFTTMSVFAALTACGGEASRCPLEDSGASDDSSEGDGGTGAVVVHGTFSNSICPALSPLGASPDNGGFVDLTATVSDTPPNEGVPTFNWSATNGIFKNPHALDTTFQCVAIGVVTLTLTVSLGDCHQQASLDLHCDVLPGGGH